MNSQIEKLLRTRNPRIRNQRKEPLRRSLIVECLESRTLLAADLVAFYEAPHHFASGRAENAEFASAKQHTAPSELATRHRAGQNDRPHNARNGPQFGRPIPSAEGEHASGDVPAQFSNALPNPGSGNPNPGSGNPPPSSGNTAESPIFVQSLRQNESVAPRTLSPSGGIAVVLASSSIPSPVFETPAGTRASQGVASNLRATAADIVFESNEVSFEVSASDGVETSPNFFPGMSNNPSESLTDVGETGLISPHLSSHLALLGSQAIQESSSSLPAWEIDISILDWLQRSTSPASNDGVWKGPQSHWSEIETLTEAMDWNPAAGGFVDLLTSTGRLSLPIEPLRWVDVELTPTIGLSQPAAFLAAQQADVRPHAVRDMILAALVRNEESVDSAELPPKRLSTFSVPAVITTTGLLLATHQLRRKLRTRKIDDSENIVD